MGRQMVEEACLLQKGQPHRRRQVALNDGGHDG